MGRRQEKASGRREGGGPDAVSVCFRLSISGAAVTAL